MRPSFRLLRSALPRTLPQLAGLPPNISYPWLRDACPCPLCIHPSTRQKLHRTTDVPITITPAQDGLQVTDSAIHVKWEDGHASEYPVEYIKRYADPEVLKAFRADPDTVAWDADTLQSRAKDLHMTYADLDTDGGLLRAMDQLSSYGLLFVRGVPTEPTDDARCGLRGLAAKFSEIRETFYGATWDVKNIRGSKNIAYTNLDLGLHMDLLYMTSPPRFQILHCLRNRVLGGTSLFVDALHAARTLPTTDIHTLSSVRVPFHYLNDGRHLHRAHPTLELAPAPTAVATSPATTATDLAARITHINYSPPFQAPLLPGTPPTLVPALARFAEALAAPKAVLDHTLREGEAVLFDNRRVLHARTAFRAPEGTAAAGEEGETDRWLKGCYFEADAMLDRRRVLVHKGIVS